MSQDVILVAGTKFEMQLPDGSWQRVPKMTSIGAIGEQADSKEKTTLEDMIKKYGSGLRDGPDKNLKGQYIPKQESGDDYYDDWVLQQAFVKSCRNQEEFNCRVKWIDGEINSFLYQALGFEFDESTQEDWKMFTCNGKQNSRTIFGVTINGGTTVTVGNTLALLITTDPSTITPDEYAGEVVWTSSDEAVATVDTNGVVTGVAAGTATITVEVRGVPGTAEITVS